MEYDHIEDINKFKLNVIRHGGYYNSERLMDYIGFISEDEQYSENERQELLEFLSNLYDERKIQEDREKAEQEAIAKQKEEERIAEAERQANIQQQKANQQRRRNRPITEYSDKELEKKYNETLKNLDRMVTASNGKDDTKRAISNYNRLKNKRDALKAEIDKRGLKLDKIEDEKVEYSKTGKLRNKKERTELNNEAIREVKAMSDEDALKQKEYIAERIAYIKEQLEKPILDSKTENAYRLDLERYEIYQKALEKRTEKINAKKTEIEMNPVAEKDSEILDVENLGVADDVVDVNDIIDINTDELIEYSNNNDKIKNAEIEVKDIEGTVNNNAEKTDKFVAEAEVNEEVQKPERKIALELDLDDEFEKIEKDLGLNEKSEYDLYRLAPTQNIENDAKDKYNNDLNNNKTYESVDIKNVETVKEPQKEKKSILQKLKENWKKIASVAVSALAAIGTFAYTMFNHDKNLALNEGKENNSITIDDHLADNAVGNAADKANEKQATIETAATSIEENLKETDETTKSWEIPSNQIQEVVEQTKEIISKQSNEENIDKNEEKLQLGSIFENLPEGLEFQEGIDGGKKGNIGSPACPTDGKYIIDHYCKLGDGTLENVSGTDGKEIDEDTQWVHISLVTEKGNEPRGWVKTEVIKKIMENQNKEMNERG